jgi:CRP/FNR family transcriptional regulator, cyclic AMP receptor protein
MAVDRKVEALRTVGLFADCSTRELQGIARICTREQVDEGAVLTKQGDPGRECFVIADGSAAVLIESREVATVGPGDCVGELSLLDGGRRTATVIARTPMTLYVLTAAEFRSLLDASPSILRKIMMSLAARLRNAEGDRPH